MSMESVKLNMFACELSHPLITDVLLSEYVTAVKFVDKSVMISMTTEIVDGVMRPYPSIRKAINSATPIKMVFTVSDSNAKTVLRRTCDLVDVNISGLESFDLNDPTNCALRLTARMNDYKEEFE